jgi:hypothetical protein
MMSHPCIAERPAARTTILKKGTEVMKKKAPKPGHQYIRIAGRDFFLFFQNCCPAGGRDGNPHV